MMIELKPIVTDADYDRALIAFAQLWGAKTGTRDGDRLDLLATLIDAYETLTYPMDRPSYSDAVAFRIDQQG